MSARWTSPAPVRAVGPPPLPAVFQRSPTSQPVRHARFLFRCLAAALVLAVAIGAWIGLHHGDIACQWACYRVGAAASTDEARRHIQWFETGPDRAARLRRLVEKWGTGNPRFDHHLAQYLTGPECSDQTREAFAAELGRREGLLKRWAHYWCWRAPQEPNELVASVVAYLDDLATVEPSRQLTWREVLDVQAVFCLAGDESAARRLTPSNWRARYRSWQRVRPAAFPHVARPGAPLPDHS